MSSNNCYYDRDFRKRDTDTGLRGKKITTNETLDTMYTDFFGRTDKVKIFECNTSGTSDEWQKPEGWLDLPMPAANSQEFYGLFPVWEYADNSIALSVTGTSQYFVDWGDGYAQSVNSGDVAEHVYDFNDIPTSTLFEKGNYRQVIVRVLMLGGDMTEFSLDRRHSLYNAYTTPWLNINLDGPNLTLIEISKDNNTILPNLRRAGLYNLNSLTALYYPFSYCLRLQHIEITGTNSLTDINYLTYGYSYGIQNYPLFNTSNVTNIDGFIEEGITRYYPLYDFSNVEYFNSDSTDVIVNYPAWDLSSVNNAPYLSFSGAVRIQVKNLKIGFRISNSSHINREGLLELFNNLGTALGSQTIILECRSKDDLTAEDIQIATDKGFTVTIA